MPKINLTDEEKIELLKAVNAGLEPFPDLLPKLFPGTAEKFDIKALDRAKIPTLEYAGKRSKAAILAEAGAGIGAAPLQIVRSFGKVKEGEWQNLIVQGDNLQFLKTCYRNEDSLIKDKVKGKVKLIYIDPPFATKSDFGGKDGEYSYTDKADRATFLETLRERLICLREILAEDGSIYIHLDQKMSHYVKIVMDEIFGKDNFVNEITWCRQSSSAKKANSENNLSKSFVIAHDTIYIYFKDKSKNIGIRKDHFTSISYSDRVLNSLETDDEGITVYNRGKGSIGGRKIASKVEVDITKGMLARDYWVDIPILRHNSFDNVNYPTQKPEKLLYRIISASTDINDIVLDCFAGSGTTVAVAEKMGRQWIACDFGKHSIYTIQKRIFRISESKNLGIDIEKSDDVEEVNEKKKSKKEVLYGKEAKPFSVVSVGAYDFSHVMALGNSEHKDTYIAFVLGLFQLGRDEDKAKKFKLTNIYADKNGSPVEVYPVWDEHYLKEIRIDEEYLKGIITQAGGRLQGEYHIITPEHCTNIGETRMKNAEGKDVIFKFLTFPYKVLEDVSRHLELHEQPASQGAVNELITSTAFYFNEDVEIELKREVAGLKLTKFETKILNKDGNRFPGFEGLAMLLIDVDHEKGKPFDMDKTIFAKEVDENGLFKIENIIDKNIAVIGIDKHGNESNPFILK